MSRLPPVRWIVVALTLAVPVALTGCGSSGPSASPATASVAGRDGTGTTATIPPGATVDNTFPPDTATVASTSTELGTILVDGTGHTLYVYLADTAGVPTCTGACNKAWPAVTGSYLAVATSVPRQDGEFKLVAIPGTTTTKQVTVNGRPLYRFVGDDLAGETKGQGLDQKWYVVGTNGQPITKALPTATTKG